MVDRNNFKFIQSKNSPDIEDAFKRYQYLIFDHQVPDANRRNAIVIDTLEVKVLTDNVEIQLGFDESYNLTIPADGKPAVIVANTVYGAFRGLETFSQIVVYSFNEEQYIIKAAPYSIFDEPNFKHRGILLDTARHFESVPTIKKFLDSMSYAKFNVLHWHIVDDEAAPIESRRYPTYFEGAYTEYERYSTWDVQEIVEYARLRGIRVIPEFDVPGHAKSWCRGLPDICPSTECLTPLDVSKNETFEFLEKFFGEFTGGVKRSGLFTDDFFHLGGDEVDTGCWTEVERVANWIKQQGWTNSDAYHYFVNRAANIVMDQGRNPVNWDDVWETFGTKLDKRIVIQVWWNYDNVGKAANSGYKVIVSNNNVWYLDHEATTWESVYTNDLYKNVKKENYDNIIGGEVAMWSERIDISDLFSTVWPRAAAAAEKMWSKPEDTTDIGSAKDRLMWFRCLLDRREINAAPVEKGGRPAPAGPGSCFTQ